MDQTSWNPDPADSTRPAIGWYIRRGGSPKENRANLHGVAFQLCPNDRRPSVRVLRWIGGADKDFVSAECHVVISTSVCSWTERIELPGSRFRIDDHEVRVASSFCSAHNSLVRGFTFSPSLWPFTVYVVMTLPLKSYSTIVLLLPSEPSGAIPLP